MYSNLGTQVGAQNEDFCCFADGLNQSLVIRVMSTFCSVPLQKEMQCLLRNKIQCFYFV